VSRPSKIEWTDRVWNPVRGCSLVSPGCTNCYAMRQAHRFNAKGQPYERLTRTTERGPVWTGDIRLVLAALEEPLRWKKPSRVFVNSMSDLFHEGAPDEFIDQVFGVMGTCRRHTFQVLTKRPERMRDYLIANHARGSDTPNVWLGVSAENQATADERIPILLQTPAAVRFVSTEPLLEPVDIRRWIVGCNDYRDPPEHAGIHWVIVGGESGPNARPCNVEWIRDIVRQCKAAGVRVFVKQIGGLAFNGSLRGHEPDCRWLTDDRKGGDPAEWPEDLRVREYPAAGASLEDGLELQRLGRGRCGDDTG
jgi:protein gp37